MTNFEQHIKLWIERLSIKHSELSGFSICPFASRAEYKIADSIDNAITAVLVEKKDIAVVRFDNNLSADNMSALAEHYNFKYKHLDVWFLYDSFREENKIDRFVTGNGEYNLILVQLYSDLQKKSKHLLQTTQYYSHWSEHYFDRIVRARDER